MKKRIFILCALVTLIIISILIYINKPSNLKIYKGNDIAISIKKNTLTKTSATIIINDNSNKNHIYGNAFLIEKKYKNKWMKMKANETWFTLIGYVVGENKTIELTQNWSNMYGELKKGTYRLLKEVGTSNEYIAVEFKIK